MVRKSDRRVVALQAGDPATIALWQDLVDVSLAHINHLYSQLDVTLTDEDVTGESFYNDRLAGTVAALLEAYHRRTGWQPWPAVEISAAEQVSQDQPVEADTDRGHRRARPHARPREAEPHRVDPGRDEPGPQHRQLPKREIDRAGRFVHHDEGEREESVDGAREQTVHEQGREEPHAVRRRGRARSPSGRT